MGFSIQRAHNCRDLDISLILIIVGMIRSKASVHHDIIQAEMGAILILVEEAMELFLHSRLGGTRWCT